MRPSIHVGIVTYALDITPLVESIGGEDVLFHVFRHSKIPEVNRAIDLLHSRHRIREIGDGTNRGLSRSWNDCIQFAYETMKADVVIIVNDDVQMTRDDLAKMVQVAREHPEAGIIEGWGFNTRMNEQQHLGFAVFGINRIAVETIGYFDVNFSPIYFEDTDYSRRCNLAGIPFAAAEATRMVHAGSSTIAALPELYAQNTLTFQKNYEYYCRKWGGSPGKERYLLPFNSERFGWQIAASQRHDPYPGFGRQDLEMVKL